MASGTVPAAPATGTRADPAECARGQPAARVPRSLAVLLFVVAFFGATWALLAPAFQSPDEDVHFAYVQTLFERHELPGSGPHAVSSAQYRAMRAMNNDPTVFAIGKPEWSRQAYERWRRATHDDPQDDGGGYNTASIYPPAYYVLETPGYALAGPHADVVSHLYTARLWSVLWLLGTTVGVWLLAGELVGRQHILQLVAAAAVGLWPMLTFMSASVNPDAALYATWTWALYVGVVILRHGLTARRAAMFGAIVALAVLVKATSLAILPGAGLVIALGLWRARHHGARNLAAVAAVAVVVAAVPVASWQLATRLDDRPAYAQATVATGRVGSAREFASYVWQFYLPRLPFMHPIRLDREVVSSWPAYNVWVASGWATFGWVTLYFPHGVYPWFLAITLLFGAAAAFKLALVVRRNRGSPAWRRESAAIALFFGLTLLCLLGGLHLTEYNLRAPVNQGRYLFPMAALAGIAVAAVVGLLPARFRGVGAGTVLGALVVFQIACLGLVASNYYA